MAKQNILSCTECRDAKLKCITSDGAKDCQRCRSRALTCTRPTRKQRARKSDHLASAIASTSAVKLEHTSGADGQDAATSKRRLEYLESVVRDLSRAVKRARGESRDASVQGTIQGDSEGEADDDDDGDDVDEVVVTPSASGEGAPGADITPSSSKAESTRPFAIQSHRVDDPGLPPLTNPLRLLAEASDDLYAAEPRRSESVASASAPAVHQTGADSKVTQDARQAALMSARSKPSSSHSSSVPRRPIPDYRSYFAAGLYSSRPDDSEERSPISNGILSASRAQELFEHFMGPFNSSTNLLDPKLHTFHFVRSRSNMLLCTLLVLAARVSNAPGAAQETERLERLISERIIPDILLRDLRSVEIVQGLILFAAFHCPTRLLSEDRAPTFLGHALRMASELDLNSRIVSEELQSDDEHVLRHFRNRERTWINLWLYEHSLCTHAGRRPTLSERGIIESCSDWAKSSLAVPGDEALIANVQLRNIISDHRQLYEHLGLGKTLRAAKHACGRDESAASAAAVESSFGRGSAASRSTALGLRYYLGRIDDDFKRWRARWIRSTVDSKRAAKLQLYDSYGRILSLSIPLQDLDKSVDGIQQAFVMLHEAVVLYLDDFLSGKAISSSDLISNQNSTIVTAGYVSVMALKLTSLAGIFHYIDPGGMTRRVREVASAFEAAGNVTAHRNATATSYSAYLDTLCSAVELRNQSGSPSSSTGKAGRSESRGASARSGDKAGRRGRSERRDNRGGGGEEERRNARSAQRQQRGPPNQASSVTRRDAVFLTGPSGVQQLQIVGGTTNGFHHEFQGQQQLYDDAPKSTEPTAATATLSNGILTRAKGNAKGAESLLSFVSSSTSLPSGLTTSTQDGVIPPTSSLCSESDLALPTSAPHSLGPATQSSLNPYANPILTPSPHPTTSAHQNQASAAAAISATAATPTTTTAATAVQETGMGMGMDGSWLSGEFWGDHRAFPTSEELFEWAQSLGGSL